MRVIEIRKALGMSRYRLAREAKITDLTLAGIEKGKNCPSLSTAIKLADVLKCSLDELVGRNPVSE